MSNERLVIALLEEGNPASSMPESELKTFDPTDFRTETPVRRHDMSETRTNRRTPLLLGAAAVLLVLVGLFAVLRDEADTEEAAVTTTATTAAPATTALDTWDDIPIFFFAGAEGDYRTGTGFFAEFKITLPDGWARTFPEFAGITELSPSPVECEVARAPSTCRGLLTVLSTNQFDVDATVDYLSTRPAVEAGEPSPASIGGAEGFVFNITTDQVGATIQPLADSGRFVIQPDRDVRAYVLDVGGTPVTVLVDSPDDGSFHAEVQPVLDSIVWRDLR